MRRSHWITALFVATNLAAAQEKPQPLPAVPVTAEVELVRNAKLREFDRRRSMGHGRFLTEADLEKDQYRQLSDVLKKLPGMLMVRAKRASGVSPSAVFVVNARGTATLNLESPIFGKNCPVGIWLDGVPMYRGLDRSVVKTAFGSGVSSGGGGGGMSEPPFDINSITTDQVAAIEFYAGPATMPAELNATQGTCGALVIWTK
ncbi:MAG TPA: TonB-dependent receptor plug domain-containing protein [Gemmatimonadaceae bacterium]|nr:TonB-dependent receptor plug domain-containing protein [Gemmatimonadaceae bacterium]